MNNLIPPLRAFHLLLTIDDRFPRTWRWVKRVALTLCDVLFWLAVVINTIDLIGNYEERGAWDRGGSVALILLAGLNLARYIDLITRHFDNKLSALAKQARERNQTTIEMSGGTSAMLLMRCPACQELVKIDEMKEHVDEHLDSMGDPEHQGQPVAILLRRPGATEWEKVHKVVDRG